MLMLHKGQGRTGYTTYVLVGVCNISHFIHTIILYNEVVVSASVNENVYIVYSHFSLIVFFVATEHRDHRHYYINRFDRLKQL